MAGISFELKRILSRKGFLSLLEAAGYSAVLSTGNWFIAISSIFVFSILIIKITQNTELTTQYQAYITYTIALSLIFSGPFQMMFTRFCADRLFEKKIFHILPNYIGCLIITMSLSFVLSLFLSFYLLKSLSSFYKFIFVFTVSVLSGLWITNSLLIGLKNYRYVLFSFFISYLLIGIGFLLVANKGLIWVLVIFYGGQLLLLGLLAMRVIWEFSSDRMFSLEFLNKKFSFYSLAFIGLFYNIGIWIDKIVFWFSPYTGTPVLDNIRTSFIYDIPVLLSYVSIIPGMGVFFLKLEAIFAPEYENFYKAVRSWGGLEELYNLANKMIEEVRATFYDTIRIQALFAFIVFFIEKWIFQLLRVPFSFFPVFNVLLIASLLQLSFIVLFSFLSYFDRKVENLILTLFFASTNALFSYITQLLGSDFYGYGYLISLLFSNILGMFMLRRFLNEILYKTFMFYI